ncbi:MAG: precorrin-2 C(20)-methyltransferase [Lentisphaerae bacterium GWF2_49_21]|nr:MAG: precorrin-2 C(20)-methyltransferase [Lentisphaerae bacterium GWF2_49_21]
MKTKKHTGTFYGIGVGPGDPDLVTIKAVKALKKVKYVFEATSGPKKDSIAGRIAKKYYSKPTKFMSLVFPMVNDSKTRNDAWKKNAGIVAEKLLSGHDCAFVTIGDPMIYSTCSYLLAELRKLIPSLKSEIIPGITSFQTAAAKSQEPLVEDRETLTIIPSFSSGIAAELKKYPSDSIVLMKAFRTKKEIAAYIRKNRCTAIFASRLCLKGELVTSDIGVAEKYPEEYLSLFIVKKKSRNG